MAGVLQHLRSSTLNKRPNPASMVDGQVAINYASGSPGMFFKDSNGSLVKVGPVHVGSDAPNVSPASGGTAGNSLGEQWLDTSGGTYVFKIWDGGAWRSEAGEFVNTTGDTMTGPLTMGPSASVIFEGSTDDGFETTLTVINPTADRTITLPNVSGTIITSGDTGTVTSAMIANNTIVDADINSAAAIAGTKISPNFGSQNIVTTGTDTAASFTPTSSTAPTNGIYLPAVNSVAISTAGSPRVTVTSTGVGIGTTSPSSPLHVNPGAGNNGSIRVDYGTGSVADGYLEIWALADRHYLRTVKSGGGVPLAFETNSLERVRIDSSGRLLVGTSSDSGGALLQVNGNRIRIATAKTPASATDTGTAGEICWDASYIYVCTATNTWKRTAISTW